MNLLLSHQRRSKNPGDDAAMIAARRRFFDTGFFDPLKAVIADIIPTGAECIMDCGCGEGGFCGGLSESRAGVFCGLDISKDAIRAAAKRYKRAQWTVANVMREIPTPDSTADVILSVLAPRNPPEFARILKPGGVLILGVPGKDHLTEVRALLEQNSGDFDEKVDEAVEKCAPAFAEVGRRKISYERELSGAQLNDLIQMTPLFWNSSPAAREKALRCSSLAVTFCFSLLILNHAHSQKSNAFMK